MEQLTQVMKEVLDNRAIRMAELNVEIDKQLQKNQNIINKFVKFLRVNIDNPENEIDEEGKSVVVNNAPIYAYRVFAKAKFDLCLSARNEELEKEIDSELFEDGDETTEAVINKVNSKFEYLNNDLIPRYQSQINCFESLNLEVLKSSVSVNAFVIVNKKIEEIDNKINPYDLNYKLDIVTNVGINSDEINFYQEKHKAIEEIYDEFCDKEVKYAEKFLNLPEEKRTEKEAAKSHIDFVRNVIYKQLVVVVDHVEAMCKVLKEINQGIYDELSNGLIKNDADKQNSNEITDETPSGIVFLNNFKALLDAEKSNESNLDM